MIAFDSPASILGSLQALGPPYLLLFDYDGTLTEFGVRPEGIHLSARRRGMLESLVATPGVRVGIVSGRRIEDVRERVGLPALLYAGLHGLEIEMPGWRWRHDGLGATREEMHELVREAQEDVTSLDGVFIEDKGVSFVIHWRGATAAAREEAEQALVRLVEPALHAGRVRLQRGNGMCEVLPNVAWNKGDALAWIERSLADPVSRRPPSTLFMGDDLTDEDAFAALGARGVTVVVGERRSRARYRLRSPREVEALLAALVEGLGSNEVG